MSDTISLFAVDLGAIGEAWRHRPLRELAGERARGRLAAELEGRDLDATLPAPKAVAALPGADGRALFDALAADLATHALHDAPADALGEVFAALAKLGRRPGFALTKIEAGAQLAYPPELLEDPFVDSAEGRAGLTVWVDDPPRVAAISDAIAAALALPAGSFPASDPALWRDLLERLADLASALARPGRALCGQRIG